MKLIVGGASTFTVNVSVEKSLPSLTFSVIVLSPNRSATGVTLTVRFGFVPFSAIAVAVLGTKAVLDDVAVNLK